MKNVSTDRGTPRERLLAAAQELFYEEGVNTVGIDRVIERAGVAKASLYNTFGSKEALIHAYLEGRQAARRSRIEAHLLGYATAREKLLGVFESMRDLSAESRYRGCAFVRASAEARADSSVKSVCDASRAWLRELFTGLAREAGVAEPDRLARQLVLLYDGAAVAAQMDQDPGAAALARGTAETLLDAGLA